MLNAQMKNYSYFLYNTEPNEYGQVTLIKDNNNEPVVQGIIKMAINHTSTAIQANINYKEASYIGLTFADINDKFVIQYGDELLKVLYVNKQGRYKQVFLNSI